MNDASRCLIEVIRIGDVMKVSAVDPATGIEVSVAGPAKAGEAALTRLATRKLALRLRRDAGVD